MVGTGTSSLDASTVDALTAGLVRAGDRLPDSGEYLVVFARRPDGTWRFTTDIWNSDAG